MKQADSFIQHKPGVAASENDRAPEFRAQTLPPGTAPASSSYQPNPVHEVPGQANNEDTLRAHGKESVYTKPLDTYPGATSADVNKGFGKPMQGQTSNELRHDGNHHRKHQGSGYETHGATGHPKHTEHSIGDPQKVDPRYTANQRAMDRDEAPAGRHGDKGTLGAEDIPPQPAETVARERD